MVPLASLLNPLPPSFERPRNPSQSASPQYTETFSSTLLSAKKQKMSKAAATFVKAEPKGEINYPPYEEQDETIAAAYERFDVKPVGQICEYPKRIPYNSEKKTFQQRTGRDGFEVYQYTFRMPNDDRGKDPHAVMWDYNVGLVRITSFIKSLGHSKTMPAKIMSANPGLSAVSHSITGGSISAQGYWVPFEAAKAVASRFCYNIRYVLVPVFGPEFVSMCEVPEQGAWMHLSISRSIIQHCTEAATAYQSQSRESSMAISPRTTSASTTSIWPAKPALRPKSRMIMDFESGYATDSERSVYPDSPISSEWTPVNSPRQKELPPINVTSTPRDHRPGRTLGHKKGGYPKRALFEDDVALEDKGSSTAQPPMTSPMTSLGSSSVAKRTKISEEITPDIRARYSEVDIDAACALVGLGVGGDHVGGSRCPRRPST